jgi:hypothetical protein
MGKEKTFENKYQLLEYKQKISNSLEKSIKSVKLILENYDPISAFNSFKYEKIVYDPLTDKSENLIELINQHQTYLVTIKGLEYLFEKYPSKSFVARLGNISGFDIESTDKEIIAECFAQVNFRNNNKLCDDLEKLNSNSEKMICYEFFYDKKFNDHNHSFYKAKYPKIHIIKFDNLN